MHFACLPPVITSFAVYTLLPNMSDHADAISNNVTTETCQS